MKILGMGVLTERFYKWFQGWRWFFIGKCYFCGGTLEEPWDEKHQYCTKCGKNN